MGNRQPFSCKCSFTFHATNCLKQSGTVSHFFPSYQGYLCQYHSTSVPYSFIHLPPTLYSVFLPILQFPMSVSFHKSSILIHSSTTDAVLYFSSSTPVSPVSIIPPILHTHSAIYHRRCITFFSQYFSFSCQYHSTLLQLIY
jgi:hypothetical protein